MPRNHNKDYELVVRVAWYYYKTNLTQEEIARRLNITRARVIKILDAGRRQGIISVHIKSPYTNCLQLEKELCDRWGLRDAVIIPQVGLDEINPNLGAAGAQYIEMNLGKDESLIALSWGNTVSLLLQHLSLEDSPNVSLVAMSGGLSAYLQHAFQANTNPLSKFQGRIHLIPSPLVVSSPDTARSIADEPEVRKALQRAELANIALVGIGSLSPQATVTSYGYITATDLDLLRQQGAVGDILAQYFDRDGNLIDVDHHGRLISIHLDKLKKMKHVIGVAGGEHKTEAIKAAMRAGYIQSLITDEKTAAGLMLED